MDFNLRNRTVVITGGSAGIGKALAKTYLEEGASVTVCGRNQGGLWDPPSPCLRLNGQGILPAFTVEISGGKRCVQNFHMAGSAKACQVPS